MKAVLQRVKSASVAIDGKEHSAIGKGLLLLVGVEHGDGDGDIKYIVDKSVSLRIFEDDAGKMNRSVQDIGGSLLVVSQFTLLADVSKGRRPSFIAAAPPEVSVPIYERTVETFKQTGLSVETGVFGADMMISLVNDGPVTIMLDSRK